MLAGDTLHFTHTRYVHALCLNMWMVGPRAYIYIYVIFTGSGSQTHSITQTQTHKDAKHPPILPHRRTTGSCNCIPVFPSTAEVSLESCPETRMGKREKKQPKDYITQLINKLMRSHFLRKIVSRQKVPPQPFFLPLLENQLLILHCGKRMQPAGN